MLADELALEIICFSSGPLGGDMQLGAKIADGGFDFLIFFWVPLEPQPHDTDIKTLLRLAILRNIPTACNRATADFLTSSPIMGEEYEHLMLDLDRYAAKRSLRI